MDLAGVGKVPRRVEDDRRYLTGVDHPGVETGTGGRVLVVVGVDEGNRLPQIDSQFAGDEPARVVADDTNLNCPLGNDACYWYRLLFLIRVIGVAGTAVVLVIVTTAAAPSSPTPTRAIVVVSLLRKYQSALIPCRGPEQQEAARSSRDRLRRAPAVPRRFE